MGVFAVIRFLFAFAMATFVLVLVELLWPVLADVIPALPSPDEVLLHW
jgi:hypothetical protein